MPDAQKVIPLVRRAAMLFRGTPGRAGALVKLDRAKEVLVVGDLHGNVEAFRRVLALADLNNHPDRHLVLQELVHGDFHYPNGGGDKSHQLVDLVAALKCQNPDRAHLILGNHELAELTGRSIAKNGAGLNSQFKIGLETAYGNHSAAVLDAYKDLFRSLPLAVRTPNRVYLCHTIPDGDRLDQLDLSILKTGVWPPEALKRRGTVYELTWGRDITPETADRFAALVDADFFIIGHHACDEGFRIANHRLLIVDGTPPLPAYCLFDAQAPTSLEALHKRTRLLNGGLAAQ